MVMVKSIFYLLKGLSPYWQPSPRLRVVVILIVVDLIHVA